MTFNENDHPRAGSGAFTDKAQSASEVVLGASSPVTAGSINDDLRLHADERTRMFTAFHGFPEGAIVDYAPLDPSDINAETHGVHVLTADGSRYLVVERLLASGGIRARILNGEASRIRTARLAGACSLRPSLFDILKDTENGEEEIQDLIKRQGHIDSLVQGIAQDDDELSEWFGSSEPLVKLDGNKGIWSTVAIRLRDE